MKGNLNQEKLGEGAEFDLFKLAKQKRGAITRLQKEMMRKEEIIDDTPWLEVI